MKLSEDFNRNFPLAEFISFLALKSLEFQMNFNILLHIVDISCQMRWLKSHTVKNGSNCFLYIIFKNVKCIIYIKVFWMFYNIYWKIISLFFECLATKMYIFSKMSILRYSLAHNVLFGEIIFKIIYLTY